MTALSPTVRLAVFAAVLLAAFGSAWAVGASVGPTTADDLDAVRDAQGDGMSDVSGGAAGDAHGGEGHDEDGAGADPALPGLTSTVQGYTFAPVQRSLAADPAARFEFRVTGPDGDPVTAYDEAHEKDLHLVVVRRDLSGFQHVHPTLDTATGTWSVDLDLSRAGTWRAYADVVPSALGENVVLGTDLDVAGDYQPVPVPAPASVAEVDGFEVRLAGHPAAGEESELTFTVSRAGRPVDTLQPYLGAFGHLVTLRADDLAYLHTHPGEDADAGTTGGPDVSFMTTFPSPGTYRLFLDFRAGGSVHTAELTVEVGRHR